ncbi:MAG: type II toxin-antitoxin system RelE/ParE family toxin [Methylococcales bacterium]|nr:type II toxin-antitoxin system RelE/ParE family toxin [Methylococcales bacterium]
MKIYFLEIAEKELDDAFEWYEVQQKQLGKQFINELEAAIKRIIAYPEYNTLIDSEIRRCLIKRFPYGIFYKVNSEQIVIIAVAHLHRKPNYWVGR